MSCSLYLKKIFIFFILFSYLKISWGKEKIKILTYSSFMDKGGLGEWIQQQRPDIEFQSSKDFSGILGELRKLKRQNKLSSIDLVLGLNEINYKSALQEKLIEQGVPFEKSGYTILVNKKLLKEEQWPRSWKELAEKFSKKILVQDPRTSEIGLAWLLNAKDLSNLSLAEAKKIPLKVFPKWSSSFGAFENEMAPMIWTYTTSLAYYRCHNSDKNYANLPLPNYPFDTNYVAATSGKPNETLVQTIKYLSSKDVQEKIWQKNWMFPASNSQAPSCYKNIFIPRNAKALRFYNSSQILGWLDEWSL